MAEGREGDWECSGCNNRNYAFRSFCNRCKQPRLLVDAKTPPNSKWLPRIGDWVCAGCTNNNYASREECKKCGQPKDLSAMPSFAMPGVLPRMQGGLPVMGTSAFQQPTSSGLNWSLPYGAHNTDQVSVVPNDWRSGDWICNCGFHNYSSRTQCKKCNAAPPALGIKRLATDEPAHDWERKRHHAGDRPAMNQYMQSYSGFGHGFVGDQRTSASVPVPPSLQGLVQLPQGPTLLGKGARHWRDGDWICSKCNNHNYASRNECNRCKTQKTVTSEPVGVA